MTTQNPSTTGLGLAVENAFHFLDMAGRSDVEAMKRHWGRHAAGPVLRALIDLTTSEDIAWIEEPDLVIETIHRQEFPINRAVARVGEYVVEITQLKTLEQVDGHEGEIARTAQQIAIAPLVRDERAPNGYVDPFTYRNEQRNGIPRLAIAANTYEGAAEHNSMTIWEPNFGDQSVNIMDNGAHAQALHTLNVHEDGFTPQAVDHAGRSLVQAVGERVLVAPSAAQPAIVVQHFEAPGEFEIAPL